MAVAVTWTFCYIKDEGSTFSGSRQAGFEISIGDIHLASRKLATTVLKARRSS
jgi:hypothetical protein